MQTDTITLRELTIRYTVKTDAAGEPIVVGRKVGTPADSAAVFTTMLQDEASEVFAMLCLSTKHRVLAYHEVSRGCLDSTLVHPRRFSKPPSSRMRQPLYWRTTIRAAIPHQAPTIRRSREDSWRPVS